MYSPERAETKSPEERGGGGGLPTDLGIASLDVG